MNLSSTGSSRQIVSYFKIGLINICSRHTCKIAVEVEEELHNKLENNEIKPRHHPGIIKSKNIELPTQISHALEKVCGDHPIKKILKDSKLLNQYINGRHPPLDQLEIRAKTHKIIGEIDQRMPPQQLDMIQNESEMLKFEQQRQRIINRTLGERIYAWKPISYGAYESIVYAIGRSAKEYAILKHILTEIVSRDPDFKPRSYFDFGSGVGTGTWAASNFWKESIYEYFNVDCSRDMHDLAELILREGNENQQMTLKNVYYRQFLPGIETKYNLVISSFSLFELPSEQSRKDVLLNLWQKCDGYLILVEEGTRRGFELITEARDYLLRQRNDELIGHVFAPCAHDLFCPRLANLNDHTPCNFEVSYIPLKIGNARSKQLTARYSYVVLKKGEPQDPTLKWPRLVRPTLPRSKHAICRMCTADAKLQEIIFTQSKHGRIAYRCAKVSRWGDRLPITVGEPFEKQTSDESGKEILNDSNKSDNFTENV